MLWEAEKLLNKLHKLFSRRIIAIKLKGMKWEGMYVERNGEIRNAYKIFVGQFER
jgi:hypothetical protein